MMEQPAPTRARARMPKMAVIHRRMTPSPPHQCHRHPRISANAVHFGRQNDVVVTEYLIRRHLGVAARLHLQSLLPPPAFGERRDRCLARRLIAVRWRAGLMKRPRKRLRMSSLLLASINTHYNVFLSEQVWTSNALSGDLAPSRFSIVLVPCSNERFE